MSEFGENVVLTGIWARSVLKSIDWVKLKGTTGKMEPLQKLLAEEKFTFQMSIAKVAYECDIPSGLIMGLGPTTIRLRYLTSHLENIPSTLKVLRTFQAKELMTNARLQPHLQCLQLGISYRCN